MPRTKGAKTIREPERSRLKEAVCRAYENGQTIADAAADNHISYATAYRFLLDSGVDRRRPHESRQLGATALAS